MQICRKCKRPYSGDERTMCPHCGHLPEVGTTGKKKEKTSPFPGAGPTGLLVRCIMCGELVSPSEKNVCPVCKTPLVEPVGLPWQARRAKRMSAFRAVWKTTLGLFRNPEFSFAKLKLNRGFREPLAFQLGVLFGFAYVLKVIHRLVPFLWPLKKIVGKLLPVWGGIGQGKRELAIELASELQGLIAFSAFCLVAAVVANRTLSSMGGVKRGVCDTYAVFAYGLTASYLMFLVPIMGPLIGVVWGFIMIMGGLRQVHRVQARHAFGTIVVLLAVYFLFRSGLGAVRDFVILKF